MPDEVTPDTGVDDTGSDNGGLSQYNPDSIKPEHRDIAIPYLVDMEKQINSKLQDAANYRKQWTPYEELGLTDVDPNYLKELMQFGQIAADTDQFSQWWKQIGEERGLFPQESDLDDLDLDDDGIGLDAKEIQAQIQKYVEEQTSPLKQQLEAQNQEREAQEAQEWVQGEIAKIREAEPDLPAELFEDGSPVMRLAVSYADDDPDTALSKAVEDYKSFVGKGESGLLSQKVNQPVPPEGPGGKANTSPESFKDIKDATNAAIAALNNQRIG